MAMAPIPQWLLRRSVRRPGSWVLFLGVVALVPLLVTVTPVDFDRRGELPWAMAKAWILPVGIAGGVLGMRALGSIDDFLLRLPPPRRVLAEAGSLLSLAVILHALLFLGAWLAAGGTTMGATLPLVWGVLLTDVHLAGLASLILCARFPHLVGSVVLVLLAWLLPGLAAGAGIGMDSMAAILDTTRYGTLGLAQARLEPILALRVPAAFLLGAWLVRCPLRRRPSQLAP